MTTPRIYAESLYLTDAGGACELYEDLAPSVLEAEIQSAADTIAEYHTRASEPFIEAVASLAVQAHPTAQSAEVQWLSPTYDIVAPNTEGATPTAYVRTAEGYAEYIYEGEAAQRVVDATNALLIKLKKQNALESAGVHGFETCTQAAELYDALQSAYNDADTNDSDACRAAWAHARELCEGLHINHDHGLVPIFEVARAAFEGRK